MKPQVSDDDANCFVARCKCASGLIFAAVDLPEHRKNNAKEVAKLIRDGYRVDNMPLSEVRKSKFCFAKECGAKPQPQQTMF